MSSWMAKVRSIPISFSARTISSRTPSSAKLGGTWVSSSWTETVFSVASSSWSTVILLRGLAFPRGGTHAQGKGPGRKSADVDALFFFGHAYASALNSTRTNSNRPEISAKRATTVDAGARTLSVGSA
ncbi:hypothetical protein H351_21870 [Rhodococcus erythropolis R138]|nr:hypothetical protein H351_21870 [Rhodococcus erythropolis R138]